METRTHRPDLHVLQYLGDYPNCNLESTMDLAQLPGCHRYGNISYEPSEMLNFGSNSPLLVSHRSDVMNVNQEVSGSSSSRMDNNAFFISSTQNCGSWNVANPNIQSPMFVGGSYPGVLSPNNNAPSLANNQSNEIHGQYTQKQFEDMQHEFASSSSHYRSSSSVQEVNNNGDSHRWQGEFEGEPKPTNVTHIPNTQALSLSLSSVSPSRLNPRCVVPFGPFTGYATILRSSRFLKPAQQLLDELCSYSGHMGLMTRMSEHSEKVWDEVNLSSEVVVNAANTYCMGSSNEYHQRSDQNQQTRVKLLHMQDEVCRKYSQYRQQMQMVVSSFESVAGLSAATPYIFLALKATARSFSSLNNAISDQLKNTCKAKGEDKSLSPTGEGKGDRLSSRLKLADHGVEKHNGSMGFLDPQPHVWRPQRGLPERAVSVLRAWLFDHFLHPYPTDTDKHMLATQTGLSRNQVSNWFINARVRVWKPMVEEIHMLETKAIAAQKGSRAGEDGATHPKTHSNTAPYQTSGPHTMSVAPGMGATTSSYIGGNQSRTNDHNTCPHLPPGMDGPTLMGVVPYQQGNLGSVSLTLGLRQSADGATQKQLHPHQQQQLGSHQMMVHDYFG